MPIAMGLVMGPMMLWMLHGMLTGDGPAGLALLAFVGAHIVVASVVLITGLFAASLSPSLRARLDRLHRPSLRHVGLMLGAALTMALIVHLVVHGGL